MNKKDLKWYEAPICEVVELDVATPILAGSAGNEPGDVPDEEIG